MGMINADMRRRRGRRRLRVWLGGLAVLLLLLAAGYTAWWYVLSRRVEAGFEAWVELRRAEGWRVDVGASRLAGWPTMGGVELSDLRVSGGGPELPIPFTWEASKLQLKVAPFDPSTLLLEPHGEQLIGGPDGPTLALRGGTLRGWVPLDRPGPPWTLSGTAEGVHVRPVGGGGEAVVGRASAQSELAPAATAAGNALVITLRAGRIDLPSGRSWPLGEHIEGVAGEAAISGPVPPPGAPASEARMWRDAGGTAVLRWGTLRWGPLDASATARASLDPSLQPVAEGTARITGWSQALDVLAAHHVITDHAALAAKAVISLLAETPPDGGPSVLTAPFGVRDGVLAVRQIPLARLPALRWPGA